MRLLPPLSLRLVGAVAGLVVWNLRGGFAGDRRVQDGEQLIRLMVAAECDLARRGALPTDWRRAPCDGLNAALVSAGRAGLELGAGDEACKPFTLRSWWRG